MKKIILPIVALAVLIFFHTSIIGIGLKIGLSFTFSLILPYMLQFFAICYILYQAYSQFLTNVSYGLRRLLSLVILVGGCGIAFAVNPIYEGDFNHTYREITLVGEQEKTFEQGLTMIALPGCPHCYERLEEMKQVKEIYPALPMYVLVTKQDTLALEEYQERSNGVVRVDLFPNSNLLRSIIHSGYPNMMYKPSPRSAKLINWDNQGFGSAAWDYVLKEEGL